MIGEGIELWNNLDSYLELVVGGPLGKQEATLLQLSHLPAFLEVRERGQDKGKNNQLL